MKREFLKSLGLADDVIEKIMAEHGTSVQAKTDRIATLEQEAAASKTQIEGLTAQISQRDADIAELQKHKGTAEELSGKLTTLQQKYDDDTKALNTKLTEQANDFAAEKFLDGYKFTSKAARRAVLADFRKAEGVKYVDGQIVGGKEFMVKYMADEPDCFVPEDGDKGGDDGNGAGGNGGAGAGGNGGFPRFTPPGGGQGGGQDGNGGNGNFDFSGFNLVRPLPTQK